MLATQSMIYLTAIVALFIGSRLHSHYKKACFFAKNKCEPPPSLPQKWWLFGLDSVYKFDKWTRERQWLEEITAQFAKIGSDTYSLNLAGMSVLVTKSSENAKAIMASQAEDFELSDSRIKSFAPTIGEGPSGCNGASWAHGRAILRPSFSKAQVSGTDVYERHFQALVANTPVAGETVDLRVLFSRLTLDVATEISFGESIHSQQEDAP
jgi:cytochrome P450